MMRDEKEILSSLSNPAVSDGAEYMHSATSFAWTFLHFDYELGNEWKVTENL